MRSTSLALVAGLALISSTLAVPNQPRIYFPRHVKREFSNSTNTRDDVFPSPEEAPAPEETAKRQSSPFDGLLGNLPFPLGASPSSNSDDSAVGTAGPAVQGTGSPNFLDTLIPSGSDSSITDKLPVVDSLPATDNIPVVDSLPITDSLPVSGLPLVDELPTSSILPLGNNKEDEEEEDDDKPDSKSSDGGLLLAPTGLVESILPTSDDKDEPTIPLLNLPSLGGSDTPTATLPDLLGGSTDPAKETTNDKATITPPPEKTGGLLGGVVDTVDSLLDPVTPLVSSIVNELPPPLNTTELPLNTTDLLKDLPSPSVSIGLGDTLLPGDSTATVSPTPTEPVLSKGPEETGLGTATLSPGFLNGTSSDAARVTASSDSLGLEPPTTTYTSIPVVSTVSGTDAWLGTKLAVDTSLPTANPSGPAPTKSEPLPSDIPSTIDAQDATLEQPEGTTKIRVAFGSQLQYLYVSKNFTASQQIFGVMPNLISHAEGTPREDIKMINLEPLDTTASLGYLTTAVYAFIPTSIVQSLQLDIKLPSSLLYHHPSEIGRELASNINPAIEIIPNSDVAGVPGGPAPPPTGDGTLLGGNAQQAKEQTPQQKGASVGIALGAVSLAAAYGAAMFLVARRYKRRKQSHRRSSSIANSSEMQYSGTGNPAMMGGALLSQDFSSYGGVSNTRDSHGSGGTGRSGMGNSGRTAYISAPVAAENSLGWN